MKCDVIKEIIPAYIDHSASQEEMKIVEEHLCVCNECREFLSRCMDVVKPIVEPKPQEEKPVAKIPVKSDDMFNYIIVGVAVIVLIFFIILAVKK